MARCWFRPRPVHDDRGQPTDLLLTRQAGRCDWPLAGDDRVRRLIDRLIAATRPANQNAWFIGLVVIGPLALFGTSAVVSGLSPGLAGSIPRGLIGGLVIAPIALLAGWRVHRAVRARAGQFIRLTLQEGLCAACGYNLVGLAPEQDGRVVCPECGSAWGADRIENAAPFAPGARLGDVAPRLIRSAAPMGPVQTLRDDRGQPRVLVHPRLRRERRTASTEHHERLRRAARRTARIGRFVRWPVAAVLIAMGCGIASILWWAAMQVGLRGTGTLLLVAFVGPLMFFALGLGVLLGNFGYNARRVRAALLAEGLCPSCAALLAGRTPEADGLTLCPVCDAAWRLPHGI